MARIVIIEDNPQNARMAMKLLQHSGHEVIIAQDGETGLTTVYEEHPDAVLLDMGLPDIDGQTVISLIRQHPDLMNVPVIAFTAWPEDTAHEMALAYQCAGVILKPIDTRSFVSQVMSYVVRDAEGG